MTTTTYQIVKKALQKKRTAVTASPAAARRFLVESGLWDVLEDAPIDPESRKAATVAAKKAAAKKTA